MKNLTLIFLMSFYSFANAEQTSTEFNKMKSLAGNWQAEKIMNGKSIIIKVNYKVSSAGSSLIETIFAGSPQEMVSVYTEVNGKINMTHYCSLKNQPTMRLQNSTKDTLEFDYIKGTNLNVKKDAHMHHLSVKFKNKNTVEQQWTQFKNGKSVGTNVILLSRVN